MKPHYKCTKACCRAKVHPTVPVSHDDNGNVDNHQQELPKNRLLLRNAKEMLLLLEQHENNIVGDENNVVEDEKKGDDGATNATSTPAVTHTTAPEEKQWNSKTKFVVDKYVVDHQNGDEAIYLGFLDTATRAPHGKGALEFIKTGRFSHDDGDSDQQQSCRERLPATSKKSCKGDLYEGAFSNGHKHGTGVMRFADGRVFEGEYDNGEMKQGKMTHPDGSVHDFSPIEVSHPGPCVQPAKRCLYEGEFLYGSFHGNGKMTWTDGGWYEGEWRDGRMHGHGKEMLFDGFIGQDGEGECRRGQPAPTRSIFSTCPL